jgi:hypothetical protein
LIEKGVTGPLGPPRSPHGHHPRRRDSGNCRLTAATSGFGHPEALIEWTRVISSPGNDWINDLVLLRNGDVGAAGFTGRRDDPPSDWSAVVAEIDPDGGTGRSWLPDTAGR